MTIGFDLGLTPAQERLKDGLHAIARGELRARAADAERDGVDLSALRAHADHNGFSPARFVTEEVEPHTLLVALEELAYGDPSHAYALVPLLQVATITRACGDDDQRRRVGEVLAAPTATASLLLYEDYGRQPGELETSLRAQDHGWVATGRKASVAHPAGADVTVVVGRDGDALTAVVATGRPAGVEVLRDDRVNGKIGLEGVPTGAVRLDDAAFGPEDGLSGGLALERAVGLARLLPAAVLIGLARATVEFCAGYAVHRTSFGKPLAEHQAVAMPLIEHHTETEEVRLLLWDVAARLPGLDRRAAIESKVTRVVNRASSLALRASRDGVQLVGVRAITRDLPSERWYRDAAALAAIDFDVLQTPFGLN